MNHEELCGYKVEKRVRWSAVPNLHSSFRPSCISCAFCCGLGLFVFGTVTATLKTNSQLEPWQKTLKMMFFKERLSGEMWLANDFVVLHKKHAIFNLKNKQTETKRKNFHSTSFYLVWYMTYRLFPVTQIVLKTRGLSDPRCMSLTLSARCDQFFMILDTLEFSRRKTEWRYHYRETPRGCVSTRPWSERGLLWWFIEKERRETIWQTVWPTAVPVPTVVLSFNLFIFWG